MQRTLIVGAVLLGLSLPAMAQDAGGGSAQLGAQGQKVFGADRLFGISNFKGTLEVDGFESSISGTSVNLLAGPPLTGDYELMSINPFAVPRLTFDYFVADNLSVGGSAGYFSINSEWENDDNEQGDFPETRGYVFAPRVGYVLPLADNFGAWLMGSLHYVKSTTDDSEADFEVTITLIDVSAQGMLYFIPTPGFALMAGVVADIGVGGEIEAKSSGGTEKADAKFRNIGLTTGLIGYF